jgi:CelD/BcsL family acetyltransferase involved in cellulose biosynthesis
MGLATVDGNGDGRGALRARVARSLEDVGLSTDGWNALAARSATNTVFQTQQWNRSWLEAFPEQYDPVLIAALNETGAVSGVAPLVLDRSRPLQRILRFVGHRRADYSDVLGGDDPRATLSAVLGALDEVRGWSVAKLSNIPASSPTVVHLPALAAARGWHVHVRQQFDCPTLIVNGRLEEAQRIGAKASLRRPVNYFRRLGRLEYRDLRTREEIEPLLDHLFAQHAARRQLSGHENLFAHAGNRALYRRLTEYMSGTGWLVFSVALLNDVPLSCHFGFDYNDVVTWYKPSFDVAYATRSPGLLMVKHLIDYVIKHNRRELDFTVGDEPFKRRFTNDARQTVEITMSRSRTRLEVDRLWSAIKRQRAALARR